MPATTLLPPIVGVRIAWARTGLFSSDPHSQHAVLLVEAALKDMKDKAGNNETEQRYLDCALPALDACFRSLDTAYKGRDVNFQENGKLRSAYLESIQESLEFGKKAKDVLKSLPAMAIGGAGGATVAELLKLSPEAIWGFGLALAAAGYLVNLVAVRKARRGMQMEYVRQDYERGLYYDQYVNRVSLILTSLYMDLDRFHKNIFGESYPLAADSAEAVVRELFEGVRPTFCPYLHKHMQSKMVTPELWPLCETGSAHSREECELWEGKPAS